MKKRLDSLLVEKGLAADARRAVALIMSGSVFADGDLCRHAGDKVADTARLEVVSSSAEYVSRGGLKLEGALDDFSVSVEGLECCDVGSSTGGFTECLLRRGAAKVYAFDVGKNLMHERVARDPRVVLIEDYNFKNFAARRVFTRRGLLDAIEGADGMLEPFGRKIVEPARRCRFVAVDVSFISVSKILYALASGMNNDFDALVLVKPQFELPPKYVPGGVVRDESRAFEAVEKVKRFARAAGFEFRSVSESRIKGVRGNREFFIFLSKKAE